MNTKTYLAFLSVLFGALFSANSIAQDVVLFDKDRYLLTSASISFLDSLAETITNPAEELLLIGHTDSDASDAYNKELSLNRAKAVRSYFEDKGITNRFHIEYKGERAPLNKNRNEGEMSVNRRVEIVREFTADNKVFNSMTKTPEVFVLDNSKDTVLLCNEGTEIAIKAGSFQTDSDTPITFSVAEFYNKGEFVSNNLTTLTSDGRQLISGGMLKLTATQNGQELDLASGKEIDLKFRDREEGDEMILFNGVDHGTDIAWEDPSTANEMFFGFSFRKVRTVGGDTVMIETMKQQRIDGKLFEITKKMERDRYESEYTTTVDTVPLESKNQLNSLIMRTSKLGWINCDKFAPSEPLIDFYVDYEGDFIPAVLLVFRDINSVLSYSTRENNRLIFKNIPADRIFDVVGLFSEDGTTLLYGREQYVKGDQEGQKLEFKEESMDKVFAEFSSL